MGVGPSREEQIETAIGKLPSPALVFPGYYHMESRFLENEENVLKYWQLCWELGFEKLEIPFAATIFNFLRNEYSVESDLQAINIEKSVINQLNAFIKSEVAEIENALKLLQSKNLTDSDRSSYLINGIAGCSKIVNLFSNEESYLFKSPLVSAPILINIVPLYMELILVRYKETKSLTVRDDLRARVTAFKRIVDSHMDRAMTERLRHVKGEICPADNGSFYVYYDHIFPEKLELLSVWYPGESMSFRYRLSGQDTEEIIGHYRGAIRNEYNSYFEKSTGMIDVAVNALKHLQEIPSN